MKRPMFFFACSECAGAQATSPAACNTSNFFVEDERLLSLGQAARVKLLGVPSGTKQLGYLRGAIVSTLPASGFVFDDGAGTGQYVEPAPKVTLPLHTGAFRYLILGTSAAKSEWRMLRAPEEGEFILKVVDGEYELVDSGQIPGINEVGGSGTVAAKGRVVVVVETEPGVFALQKIAVTAKRVLVGDTADDVLGYKVLPDLDYLEHPRMKVSTSFQTFTFETLDAAGAPIVGGLATAVVTGINAITDGVRMIYSPAVKRILKEPPRVYSFTDARTLSASVTPPTAYAAMPSGHGVAPNLTFNYPLVKISATIRYAADTANTTLALFRDGAQVYEWVATIGNQINLVYIDSGVTLAAHTYDIRWKRGTAAVACRIAYSSMTIETLG